MSYEIEIQPAGIKYLAGADDTILNAALTNKLFLDHSCRKGGCGLCTATVLSGSVKNEHGNIVAEGNILTCSSYPCGNLSIKINYFSELADISCLTLPCKVVSCDLVADKIIILKFKYPTTVNFQYLAGQYIDLIYKGVRRSYSIANAKTNLPNIELHIRLLPEGEFSQLLLEDCSINQLMQIEGPKGVFFIREATNPLIFLAGGTGFAPIKAMVETLVKNKVNRPIYIYWGMPNAKSFYTDIPKHWAATNTQIHFIPVVSGEDTDWRGRIGLVHEAVIKDFTDLKDYHVYACGSPLMISHAKETFISRGLESAHFYSDIFVPSK